MTSIFRRIPCEKIMIAARAVWTDYEIADDIASNALQILAKTSKQNIMFFCGKTPKATLGGLFYLLGFRFKALKTQKEIADFLCTTEVSICKSYKVWLKKFPSHFTDVEYMMQTQDSSKSKTSNQKKTALMFTRQHN